MEECGMKEKNYPLQMVREDLEDIPAFGLPSPYRFRMYQAGDEVAWVAIHEKADRYNQVTLATFREQFGTDEETLKDRQMYLCDGDGSAVGTITAWFDQDESGEAIGRVHWVAIVPAHQGKGLAKPMMTAVLERLRALGHVKTVLLTDHLRGPAVNLYLKFGFKPVIANERDREVWEKLQRDLSSGR